MASSGPIRVLIFTVRHPSKTPVEFKEYYLNNHLPFVRGLMGSANAELTTLSFLTQPTAPPSPGPGPEFDCVTELLYRDQEHIQVFMQKFSENRPALAEDEANFLDVEKSRVTILGPVEHIVIKPDGTGTGLGSPKVVRPASPRESGDPANPSPVQRLGRVTRPVPWTRHPRWQGHPPKVTCVGGVTRVGRVTLPR
jgi:hypothetical protein